MSGRRGEASHSVRPRAFRLLQPAPGATSRWGLDPLLCLPPLPPPPSLSLRSPGTAVLVASCRPLAWPEPGSHTGGTGPAPLPANHGHTRSPLPEAQARFLSNLFQFSSTFPEWTQGLCFPKSCQLYSLAGNTRLLPVQPLQVASPHLHWHRGHRALPGHLLPACGLRERSHPLKAQKARPLSSCVTYPARSPLPCPALALL